jgi:hypothetical protein
MSDPHEIKTAAAGQTHSPDDHPVDYNNYLRRCIFIFIAVICAIGLMIFTSYLPVQHYSWAFKVVLILAIAACNAFLVAGFLMHLLSEKKMVYTVLGFTVFFVTGLFALTIYALHDFPSGTQLH